MGDIMREQCTYQARFSEFISDLSVGDEIGGLTMKAVVGDLNGLEVGMADYIAGDLEVSSNDESRPTKTVDRPTEVPVTNMPAEVANGHTEVEVVNSAKKAMELTVVTAVDELSEMSSEASDPTMELTMSTLSETIASEALKDRTAALKTSKLSVNAAVFKPAGTLYDTALTTRRQQELHRPQNVRQKSHIRKGKFGRHYPAPLVHQPQPSKVTLPYPPSLQGVQLEQQDMCLQKQLTGQQPQLSALGLQLQTHPMQLPYTLQTAPLTCEPRNVMWNGAAPQVTNRTSYQNLAGYTTPQYTAPFLISHHDLNSSAFIQPVYTGSGLPIQPVYTGSDLYQQRQPMYFYSNAHYTQTWQGVQQQQQLYLQQLVVGNSSENLERHGNVTETAQAVAKDLAVVDNSMTTIETSLPVSTATVASEVIESCRVAVVAESVESAAVAMPAVDPVETNKRQNAFNSENFNSDVKSHHSDFTCSRRRRLSRSQFTSDESTISLNVNLTSNSSSHDEIGLCSAAPDTIIESKELPAAQIDLEDSSKAFDTINTNKTSNDVSVAETMDILERKGSATVQVNVVDSVKAFDAINSNQTFTEISSTLSAAEAAAVSHVTNKVTNASLIATSLSSNSLPISLNLSTAPRGVCHTILEENSNSAPADVAMESTESSQRGLPSEVIASLNGLNLSPNISGVYPEREVGDGCWIAVLPGLPAQSVQEFTRSPAVPRGHSRYTLPGCSNEYLNYVTPLAPITYQQYIPQCTAQTHFLPNNASSDFVGIGLKQDNTNSALYNQNGLTWLPNDTSFLGYHPTNGISSKLLNLAGRVARINRGVARINGGVVNDKVGVAKSEVGLSSGKLGRASADKHSRGNVNRKKKKKQKKMELLSVRADEELTQISLEQYMLNEMSTGKRQICKGGKRQIYKGVDLDSSYHSGPTHCSEIDQSRSSSQCSWTSSLDSSDPITSRLLKNNVNCDLVTSHLVNGNEVNHLVDSWTLPDSNEGSNSASPHEDETSHEEQATNKQNKDDITKADYDFDFNEDHSPIHSISETSPTFPDSSTSSIDLPSPVSLSPPCSPTESRGSCTDLMLDTRGTVAGCNQSVYSLIHNTNYREYCKQTMDRELNDCCTELLLAVSRSNCNSYSSRDMQSNTQVAKRIVLGIKEVTKHVKAGRVKVVIISPNLESTCAKDGLDESLRKLLTQCQQSPKIEHVFALSRHALGRACAKPVPISVVGVVNIEGVEDIFARLCQLTRKARHAYQDMLTNLQQRINSSPAPSLSSMTSGSSRAESISLSPSSLFEKTSKAGRILNSTTSSFSLVEDISK